MRSDKKITFANKTNFRKYCLKKLKKTKKIGTLKNNALALEKLKNILKDLKFKTILCYIPLNHELDIRKLFPKLRKNHTLLVPFMEGISFKVVKYRMPLYEKRYSIKEPFNSCVKYSNIDIMIVPVLGVDGELGRIGFGKGMYDRFYQSLKNKPFVIFVQVDGCLTSSVITQNYDIKADVYITPKKIIKRGRYGHRIKHFSSSSGCKLRSWLPSSQKNKRRKL